MTKNESSQMVCEGFTLIELLAVIAGVAFPAAMNVLWGDSHVVACTTKAAFDPTLWGMPGNTDTPNKNASKSPKVISLFKP